MIEEVTICPNCGARIDEGWERVMDPSSRLPLMMLMCNQCKHVLLEYVDERREEEDDA